MAAPAAAQDPPDPAPIDLGDITALPQPAFRPARLAGAAAAVQTYQFTLTAAQAVGLGVRQQDADADLYLTDATGTERGRSEAAGTAPEWIQATLLAGTYTVRVEAREAGENQYVLRYGVSAPDADEVARLEAERDNDEDADDDNGDGEDADDEDDADDDDNADDDDADDEAQTLVRGPYLQSGTASSVIIKWRTDEATDSVVHYGLAPDSLTLSATNSTSTTEHAVQLTGLSADVQYFYSVGTSSVTLAGGDSDHFVVTAPLPGTAKPTRIWVIGDSGTADRNARAVRDAFLNFTGSRDPDLWIMLGDNAYNDGTDVEYQAAVFDTYPQVLARTVLWPTLGNHDGFTADSTTESGPYYDIFSLPRNGEAGGVASGTEAYYSFDYGNMHFICLDSDETDRSADGAMMTWLAADLAANDKEWVIAFWHHPPYSKGNHDSDGEDQAISMRENAVPLLERYGVDLVLTGHSHSYERSYLIDGHYGLSGTYRRHEEESRRRQRNGRWGL